MAAISSANCTRQRRSYPSSSGSTESGAAVSFYSDQHRSSVLTINSPRYDHNRNNSGEDDDNSVFSETYSASTPRHQVRFLAGADRQPNYPQVYGDHESPLEQLEPSKLVAYSPDCLPSSYFEQPTLRRESHSSSVITDESEDMTVNNMYKIGFWILTALLILVGAIVIGLLGAGKLSFGGEKYSSSFENLQRHGARFYLLTFNDVSAEAPTRLQRDTDEASRIGRQYLERLEYYLSDVESALKSRALPNLMRVDILNFQRNESFSAVTVTALLAFDGGATNLTLSEAAILRALNESRNPQNSNWRDVRVAELKGLALPQPPPIVATAPPQIIPPPVPVVAGRCDDEPIDQCVSITDPKKVYYPNVFGHETAKEVNAAMGLFQMLEHKQCHPTIKNFTCLMLQPPCVAEGSDVQAFLPCKSYCREVVASCQSLLSGTYLENVTAKCDTLPINSCTQVCLPEHFVCERSKLCLNNASRCNGVFECGPNDYSDEKGCGCKDPNQEQCPSGHCIAKNLFCDNKNDCGDWGDQINCTCPTGHRRCATTGQCFPERFWCNDEFDCDDKSDERNCTCSISDFKCQNGFCLHPAVRCNGVNDCDDFSDEFNCECTEYQFRCDKYLCKNYINHWCNKRPDCDDGTDELANCTCKDYQFRCDNGQCIPIFEKCDGKPQCDDNSDELRCECTKDEFKCPDGKCIPSEMVCDGKFQCADGMDERQNCTCEKGKFPCNDGTCMPVQWWCDGNKECKNGEDEPANCSHMCPPDHPIRCVSWRQDSPICVHKQQLCNGHVICKYGEDERNCACDNTLSFTCPGGHENSSICLPWEQYCDGAQDCPTISEEINCECNEQHQFKCPSAGQNESKCIGLRQKCDGTPDCADGADEANCTCGDILEKRSPQRICDGIPDCPDFSDEFHQNCSKCNASTHYLCNSGAECILSDAVCDGIKDCPAGDDEAFCLKLANSEKELEKSWEFAHTGVLYGRRKGKWAPVCAQDLNDDTVLQAVCDVLGFERLERFEKISRENSTSADYIKILTKLDGSSSLAQKIDLQMLVACSSHETIRLFCDINSIKCGQRRLVQDTATSRIAGGTPSKIGAWPSYTALYEDEKLHCGATIINSQWAITAAHCVFEENKTAEPPKPIQATTPWPEPQEGNAQTKQRRHAQNIAGIWEGYRMKSVDSLVLRAGMLRNSSRSPFDQFRLVDAIIPHSMFNPKTGRNDIALLRLHSPLTYSAYVTPACIADRHIKLPAEKQQKCIAAGYGSLSKIQRLKSDELMEVALSAKDTDECQRIPTINIDQKVDFTEICAGTDDGKRDTCQGDSGGPLQCQICNSTQSGFSTCSWWLFGITSAGYTCGSPMTPGIYTKVSAYDDWISAIINSFKEAGHSHRCNKDAKFQCSLGNCIPEDKVCNKNWDCTFGEDEDRCP